MTRVLLITRNLPPLVGGMERLNWHLAEELAKLAELRIVGPAGSAELAPTGIVVREAPLRPLWRFLLRARTLARREAKAWKPDLILGGSGLVAPIVRHAARACGAQTAVYVHGLDVAVQHPLYRILWLPAIRRMHRVIANSQATADVCRQIGVAPGRIGIVHPGVDLPRQIAGSDFRQRHKLGDGPLLLAVGRLSDRKGLREFVVESLPRIVAAQPESMLLIVGAAPNHALHAKAQTPGSIQAAAEAAGVGAHLKFLGVITDYTALGEIYQATNVHVFPVRSIPGDPEGFGMVAVEAAAHGLPTVAFATGGIVDAVAEGRSGYLVPPGDYAAFADVVLRTLTAPATLRADCIRFAAGFVWPVFGAKIAAQLPGIAVATPAQGIAT